MTLVEPSIDIWCRDVLGAGVARSLFSGGHLATVTGVELHDGRQVVVKIRPASLRLSAVVLVQRHLHDARVPCPRPLIEPLPFQGQAITAETYVPADPLPARRPPADGCAELLAVVIAATPAASTVPDLSPPPPWVGWDHPGDQTWPPPDDLDVDLNAVPATDSIDRAARRVRAALRRHRAARVVGHVDWEAHNMGWVDERPAVIYDWDSLAIRPEPTIAGAAATVFGSTTGTAVAASVAETAAFLDRYQQSRRPFIEQDVRAAWAAGLWVLLYNA